MRVGLAALVLWSAASGAVDVGDDERLVFVSVHYRDRVQLQYLGARFQHVAVDERARSASFEATWDEYLALRREGINARVDEPASARLREAENALLQPDAIDGFACYRTVEETYATMEQLALRRPDLARVVDIGPTWLRSRDPASGYPMKVLVLGNTATDGEIANKPSMVLLGAVHAREYTPAEVLTRFAEWLVDGHGNNSEATWLLDTYRFHFVLQGNPDGRKRAEAGASWRKNVDTSNGACTANNYGVDLNRNFPFRWNGAAGGSSGNPCSGTYRGPQQTSEPETQNLLRYVAGVADAAGTWRGGVFPDRRGDAATAAAPADYRGLFVDLHSYSRLVLWPWAYSDATTANATALRTLGRRIAWHNGYAPKQWVGLYVADGTNTDTMYGLLGVPSYTIEMGVAFFESCATFEATTLPKNLAALRYAARNLTAPYVYPSGPDTVTVSASPASLSAGQPLTVTATIDDSRSNQSNGAEPVQAITAASAYLDQRPWSAGATRITMQASDGAYNSSNETVRAVVSTQGLAPGRHVVFVRASDASGSVGTPNAVYFTVIGGSGLLP
ncbi:MAG TPA: M14 family zinc carboxypeptidase [Lysobacter sp.]